MPFRFRLDSVLRHRLRRQEAGQLALTTAIRDRDRARDELETHELELASLRGALAWRAARGASGDDLRVMAEIIADAQRRKTEATRVLVDADAAVDVARAALLRLTQDRRVIERVRDSRRAAYDAWRAGLERKALDDVASTRHAWRRADDAVGSAS